MRKVFIALMAVTMISLLGNTATAVQYSWENDTGAVGFVEGWQIDPDSWDSFAVPKTLADGIPPEAITDGIYALEVGRPGRIPPRHAHPQVGLADSWREWFD